jgi:asparaginyl-tRNA synthetase
VRTTRDQKKFSFIEVNDGSSLTGIQVVAEESLPSYQEVKRFTTGAAVEIQGMRTCVALVCIFTLDRYD